MSRKKIDIAIIGLGFGAEFIPIYQNHPNANMYAICQRNKKKLNAIGDASRAASTAMGPSLSCKNKTRAAVPR